MSKICKCTEVPVRDRRGRKTNRTRRCKNHTKHTPYCWVHLRKKEGLRIKPSLLGRRAGMGLFTVKKIKKNKEITKFNGRITTGRRPRGNYVIQLRENPNVYQNDNNPNISAARYANSCKPGQKLSDGTNCTYNAKISGRRKKSLRQIRDLNGTSIRSKKNKPINPKIIQGHKKPLREIFVAYGQKYWKKNKKKIRKRRST